MIGVDTVTSTSRTVAAMQMSVPGVLSTQLCVEELSTHAAFHGGIVDAAC